MLISSSYTELFIPCLTFTFNWTLISVLVVWALPIYSITVFFFILFKFYNLSITSITGKLSSFKVTKVSVILGTLMPLSLMIAFSSPEVYILSTHIFLNANTVKILFFISAVLIAVSLLFGNMLTPTNSAVDAVILVILATIPLKFALILSVTNFISFVFAFELLSLTVYLLLVAMMIRRNLLDLNLSSMVLFWLNMLASVIFFFGLIFLTNSTSSTDWVDVLLSAEFEVVCSWLPVLVLIVIILKLALPPLHLWKLYLFSYADFSYICVYISLYFTPSLFLFFKLHTLLLAYTLPSTLLGYMPVFLLISIVIITLYAQRAVMRVTLGIFIALSSILTVLSLFFVLYTNLIELPLNNLKLDMPSSAQMLYIINYTLLFILLTAVVVLQNFNTTSYLNSLFQFCLRSQVLTTKVSLSLLFLYLVLISGLPPTTLFLVKLQLVSFLNSSLLKNILIWFILFFITLFFYFSNARFLLLPQTTLTLDSKWGDSTKLIDLGGLHYNSNLKHISSDKVNMGGFFAGLIALVLVVSALGLFIYTDLLVLALYLTSF